MAPMKSMKKAGIPALAKSKCNSVKKAIQRAPDCPARVKKMLVGTLPFTVGTHKSDRHPFNERFIAMIEQVMETEQSRLKTEITQKETAFAELEQAKAPREAAVEEAKATAAQTSEELASATAAVTSQAASLKELKEGVKEALAAQKSGDEGIEGLTAKKALLEAAVADDLSPLVSGTAGDEKSGKVKAVLDIGKQFGFDASLLGTAEKVLEMEAAARGAFDATCLDQLQEAFTKAVGGLTAEIEAAAPAKAERAAAVEQAEGAKAAAETSLVDLKEKAAAAKAAKAAADAAQKGAAKSLADFIPDMKAAGDGLDNARKAAEMFAAGPLTNFGELKEFKEGDFRPVKKAKVSVEETPAEEAAAEEAPAEETATPA